MARLTGAGLSGNCLAAAAAVAALASPGTAAAQADAYQNVTYPSTYVEITGGTSLGWVSPGQQIELWQNVPLGFSFTWQGNSYSTADLSTNGGLSFTAGCGNQWGGSCLTGVGWMMPISDPPNNFLAAWWSYLAVDNSPAVGPGEVRYETSGVAPDRVFTVQWKNVYEQDWQPVAGVTTLNFQIKLYEGSNLVQYAYGSKGAGANQQNIVASSAAENAAGSTGATFLPCALSCTESDFPENQVIQIGIPDDPDVTGTARLGPISMNGGVMSFSVFADMRNIGRNPANGFTFDAYLSADRTIDPATDTYLGRFPGTISVAGQTSQSQSVAVSTPRPANGSYTVGVILDPTNLVAEATEGNNVGIIPEPFLVGADLVGTVAGPAITGPGEVTPIQVTMRNRGSDPTGVFRYRIFMSSDATVDPTDVQIFEGMKSLNGVETYSVEDSAFIPGDMIPGRTYTFLLQLDADGVVAEADETNNVSVAATPTELIGPNLRLNEINVLGTSTDLYFGTSVEVEARVTNDGGATARGFVLSVVLSDNAVITINDYELLSTPDACFQPADCGGVWAGSCEGFGCVPSCGSDADCPGDTTCDGGGCRNLIGPGEVKVYRKTIVLPLGNEANLPAADSDCFIGAIVDSADSVLENSENDNLKRAPQNLRCRHPSPDGSVTALGYPARAAAGETISVFRIVRNGGNATGMIPYRYFLSSNTILTPNDIPVEVAARGLTAELELGPFTESQTADLLLVPSNIAPGAYYLGVIVDPAGTLQELDETNNQFVGAELLQISGPELSLLGSQLPDAVVGLSYVNQLRATGGDGTYRFTMLSGTLPPGISLAETGLLTGRPTERGTFAFEAQVESGGAADRGLVVLRVVPVTGPLAVATAGLPPGFVNVLYEAELAASGGASPYTWRVSGGILPGGIRLLPSGVLDGTPRVEGSATFEVEVSDSLGNSASAPLELRVVTAGTLVITTRRLNDAFAGDFYDEEVRADGGDPTSYEWSTDPARLPPGLTLSSSGSRARINGTPTRPGVYTVPVRVQDAEDNHDQVELIISVSPKRLTVRSRELARGTAAQAYSEPLTATGGEGELHWLLFAGVVPEGITLGSDGVLSGTLPEGAEPGTFNFVVQAADERGASGLGAFSITVVPAAPGGGDAGGPEAEVDDGGCGGCGAGGGSPAGLGLLLLGAALGLSRRRTRTAGRLLAGCAGALLLALPLAASAQYGVVRSTDSYRGVGGASTSICRCCTSESAAVPLPFTFHYYGQDYSSVLISADGIVSFTAASLGGANVAIPTAAAPNAFIAPWWDDLGNADGFTCGSTDYEVTGSGGRRVLTVEWDQLNHSLDQGWGDEDSYSFVLRLYEGTNIIELSYKLNSNPQFPVPSGNLSATMGLEDGTGTEGLNLLACGASCGAASFPDGATFRLIRDPELTVTSVSHDAEGYAGGPLHVSATVRNDGGDPAPQQVVGFYLSLDRSYSGDDVRLGEALPVDVAGSGGTAAVEADVVLPMVPAGPYSIIAVADDTGVVAEAEELNNATVARGQLAVRRAAPNLVPLAVVGPAAAEQGATVQVTFELANQGVLEATSSPYIVVLSANPVASPEDVVVGDGDAGVLAPGASAPQMVTIAIPATLPNDASPGGAVDPYYLAVIADPGALVAETSELDNATIATQRLTLGGGPLAVLTDALPGATVGSSYGVQLQASGGSGAIGWSATGLPPGLAVDEETGYLGGIPGVEGSFEVIVTVGDGAASASATLPIAVSNADLPLTITTLELPTAGYGLAYRVGLTAVGGCAPYVWTEVESPSLLPQGMALSADGILEGIPGLDGVFPFTVQLADGCGGLATVALALRVAPPGRLTVVTDRLPQGLVGTDYTERLYAAGGKQPFSWAVLQSKRLPLNPGDEGETFAEAAPPGLAVATSGAVSGRPTAAGLYLLTVVCTDADELSDAATVQLQVRYEQGIAVTTVSLPDAIAGREYEAELLSAGGEGFLSWTLAGGQALPDGLELLSEGRIEGSVEKGTLEGAAERTWNFLLQVRDGANRSDVRALSIRVLAEAPQPPAPPAEEPENGADTGCQASGGGISLAALLLAAAWAVGRRRG